MPEGAQGSGKILGGGPAGLIPRLKAAADVSPRRGVSAVKKFADNVTQITKVKKKKLYQEL